MSVRLILWMRTSRKWKPADGTGGNVCENLLQIMVVVVFSKYDNHLLNFCPLAVWQSSCTVRVRVCYLNNRWGWWKLRKSDSAEVTGDACCVFDKGITPGWHQERILTLLLSVCLYTLKPIWGLFLATLIINGTLWMGLAHVPSEGSCVRGKNDCLRPLLSALPATPVMCGLVAYGSKSLGPAPGWIVCVMPNCPACVRSTLQTQTHTYAEL